MNKTKIVRRLIPGSENSVLEALDQMPGFAGIVRIEFHCFYMRWDVTYRVKMEEEKK